MLNLNDRENIKNLLKEQSSLSKVARITGHSRSTIRKVKNCPDIKVTTETNLKLSNISPKLLPYTSTLNEFIKLGTRNSMRLFELIRKEGYAGSYPLVNAYLRDTLKSPRPHRRSIQVITPPGKQAQADWGHCGSITVNGKKEKLYVFTYVLGYSRALYIEFTVRQNQATLQSCHIHAFEQLGVPEEIVYDNMKTVVIGREKLPDGRKRILYTPAFYDFARYYGFTPSACAPYWPRSKGKVENGVGYVKGNFMATEFYGKTFHSVDELNRKAQEWLADRGRRIHGTTGKRPTDLYEEEKGLLHFPHLPPYVSSPYLPRQCTKDGVVHYKYNFYSVPTQYSLKRLEVREIQEHGFPLLQVFCKGSLIATHRISQERGTWVLDDSHLLEETRKEKSALRSTQKQKEANLPLPYQEVQVKTRELTYYNSLSCY